MSYRHEVTAKFLREILTYDPDTGLWVWNIRYDLKTRGKGWNQKYAGTAKIKLFGEFA